HTTTTTAIYTISLHDALPILILVMNDTKGQEQAFEAPSPTYIVTSGWMKDTIKPGDKVTVKGNPAKNGQLPMYLVTITLPNGKEDRKSTRLNSSHVSISYAVF